MSQSESGSASPRALDPYEMRRAGDSMERTAVLIVCNRSWAVIRLVSNGRPFIQWHLRQIEE